MPTFFRTTSFLNDWSQLSPEEKRLFKAAVRDMVADLRAQQGFNPALRIKRAQRPRGAYEMSWAADGRATFEYGAEIVPGEPHIVWRRIGGHEVFKNP